MLTSKQALSDKFDVDNCFKSNFFFFEAQISFELLMGNNIALL